ncbi:MAG: DsbA family protein, partial [Alphaproteobacteria bacterium]|nr:DsbA family protein [Alphaproteobacteria bacterium]
SLTCPHCAAFHAQSLPALKERYIDSGKVRLVFADFPLDRLALAASMVARCAGKDRYFAFIDVLFKQQRAWATASDPIAAIKKLAKIGGMSEAAVDGCLADAALQEGIIKRSYDASKDHGIKSTPSFLINGKLLKDQPFNRETMDAILAPLLS